MVPAVLVIDDFLRNAEEVRRQALGLSYAVGGRYPGLNSIEKLRIEGLDQVVSTLVHEQVDEQLTGPSVFPGAVGDGHAIADDLQRSERTDVERDRTRLGSRARRDRSRSTGCRAGLRGIRDRDVDRLIERRLAAHTPGFGERRRA